ncbi:MAG: hypothetical protein DRP60_05545 [Spirochaetes bacterium]|nr:MAG: hypothetical protein DRP60_05545 [Spirochaetota bacterium]
MRFIFCLMLIILSVMLISAGEGAEVWSPESPVQEAGMIFDWVQLNHSEWLKGELVSLRDNVVIFDSDEFDVQSFDWEDVTELHSSGEVVVVFIGRDTTTSRISVIDDVVVLHNTNELVERSRVLSIIPAKAGWWGLWDGRVSLGLNLRSGNTNQADLQIMMDSVHRTAFNRLNLAYIGNYSLVESTTIASNNFASFSWNYFINKRVYIIPVAYKFNNDLLTNIRQQHTPSLGFGYQILDSPNLEWDVTGAAGYQYIQYESVKIGHDDFSHSYVIQLVTKLTADITETTDIDISYTATIDLIDIYNTNQNIFAMLSVDITDNLELGLTFTWGRVGSPEPRGDGSIPKKDDFSLSAGIGFDY